MVSLYTDSTANNIIILRTNGLYMPKSADSDSLSEQRAISGEATADGE